VGRRNLNKPLIVTLGNPKRAILVDSILGGNGLPTPIAKGIGTIFMDSHNTGAMQSDSNTAVAQNLGVGIITNLPLGTISLATNHPNCFGMSHLFSPLVSLDSTIYYRQTQEGILKKFF
jgi:hypothetical protein